MSDQANQGAIQQPDVSRETPATEPQVDPAALQRTTRYNRHPRYG